MAEIWLIRHGESESNAGGVTTRQTAIVPLTARGRAQSEDMAAMFARPPGLIVATPYLRAQQSAEPTRIKFPDAAYEVWPLHEFAGLAQEKYDGTTVEQRRPMMQDYWNRADPAYVDGEGAESFNDMLDRVREGFRRMREQKHGLVAVFAHGYIMQAARMLLGRPDMPPEEMILYFPAYHSRHPVPNGGIVRLFTEEGGIRMHEEDTAIFAETFATVPPPERTPLSQRNLFMPDM